MQRESLLNKRGLISKAIQPLFLTFHFPYLDDEHFPPQAALAEEDLSFGKVSAEFPKSCSSFFMETKTSPLKWVCAFDSSSPFLHLGLERIDGAYVSLHLHQNIKESGLCGWFHLGVKNFNCKGLGFGKNTLAGF